MRYTLYVDAIEVFDLHKFRCCSVLSIYFKDVTVRMSGYRVLINNNNSCFVC